MEKNYKMQQKKFFLLWRDRVKTFSFRYRIVWALAWKFFTPVILSIITVFAWVNHEPMVYDDYDFPASIEAVGWIMEMLPLIIVLLYPIIPLYKVQGANKEIFVTFIGLSSCFQKKLSLLTF